MGSFLKTLTVFAMASLSYISLAHAQYDFTEEDLFASPVLSFNYVTSQVFKPRCYKCHSDEGGNKDGLNLETYENVYRARAKIHRMAIVKKAMPPRKAGGPLNAREIRILDNWLRAGAPETVEIILDYENEVLE